MIFRITSILLFASFHIIFAENLLDPFAPVNEKSLSNRIVFINQPIDNLFLSRVSDLKGKRGAFIRDKNGTGFMVREGDLIGKDSGKVILIERNRVLIFVRSKVGDKNVFRIEILTK